MQKGEVMKVRIELDDQVSEPEVTIKVSEITEDILQLQQYIQKQNFEISFYKEQQEYFFELNNVLFFETYDNKVFAHTKQDVYEVKYKLYELEELLPNNFVRISKSGILNTKQIYSLIKSFSSTAEVEFFNTHKKLHISRQYYKALKDKINRR